jgi:hypothetical protein
VWIINSKGFIKRRSWPDKVLSNISLERLRKSMQNLKIVGILAGIRTEHLQNRPRNIHGTSWSPWVSVILKIHGNFLSDAQFSGESTQDNNYVNILNAPFSLFTTHISYHVHQAEANTVKLYSAEEAKRPHLDKLTGMFVRPRHGLQEFLITGPTLSIFIISVWKKMHSSPRRLVFEPRWLHLRFVVDEAEFFFFFFFIWFVRLLALRPLLAYCASLGW